MRKRIYVLLALILLPILLSGCWDRKEPKSLAIVTSAFFDVTDNGEYQVTSEFLSPNTQSRSSESSGAKYNGALVNGKGASLSEAIRNLSVGLEKAVFGGENKARFFSEAFAKKDMAAALDYFLRDNILDEKPLMVVVKNDNPKDVYSSMLGSANTVGGLIENLSKVQPKRNSKSVFIDTLDFCIDYYDEGKQPVAGVIELVKNESAPSANSQNVEYKIAYEGLAAFKDNVLVGYMDGEQARAYNLVTKKIKSDIIAIATEGNSTSVLINNSKPSIKTAIQDNQVTINVKIKINMAIIQEGGIINIHNDETLSTIEEAFNKQLEEQITASIEKAQIEFVSDIFGFGKAVHQQHPDKWREIKENWDDYFSMASIHISVQSSIKSSGQIKEPFRKVTNIDG